MKDKSQKFSFRRRGVLSGLSLAPAAAFIGKADAAAPAELPASAIPETHMLQLQAALRESSGTKVVLLGTGGGPVLGGLHRQPACVLYQKGHAYLLDCGMSTADRYMQAGLRLDELQNIFITQQRPDHILGYGPLLAEGWIFGTKPGLAAYGPPGLTQMTADYVSSIQTMTKFWAEDFHSAPMQPIPTHELTGPGFVMQDDAVKVTCALANHPSVTPAFAYRFDFADRSITYASDTAPADAVVELAQGTDVLIHDAMLVPGVQKMIKAAIANGAKMNADVFMKHMMADHTPVEKLGQMAQQAEVKTLVLYHLSPTPQITSPYQVMDPAPWLEAAGKYFKGKIVFGEDLTML